METIPRKKSSAERAFDRNQWQQRHIYPEQGRPRPIAACVAFFKDCCSHQTSMSTIDPGVTIAQESGNYPRC